ncbi:MAG: phage recombination protein Bet, partial [Clostridia bacterium]
DEFALFIQVCQRTGLDPFARQIWAVRRWDAQAGREVMQVQVSIDGARLAAQRTGAYAGQAPIAWCGRDGMWRDVWLGEEPPAAARAGVYRRGFVEPVWAVATWREYAPRKRDGSVTPMWRQMGAHMLGKCAEMLALRRAFPMELSGMYTPEEMAQADNPPPAPHPAGVSAAPAPSVVRRRPPPGAPPAKADDSVPAEAHEAGVEGSGSPDHADAMQALAEIVAQTEPEDERTALRAYLRERFGDPRSLGADDIREATAIAAGWPATDPSRQEDFS